MPGPEAVVVGHGELMRLAGLELLRHRLDPGLVAFYAVRAAPALPEVDDASQRRLLATLRPIDTIGRLDDGTLAVLADGLLSAPAVFALNARMLAALQQPVVCDDGTVVEPTISIGLALTGNPLRSPEDMLRHARLSRQLAEDAGGNRIELADPEFAGLLDLVGIPRADARTL
jgi:hypothetical protein